MQLILITLPDGTEHSVEKGKTARDIAESISPNLAKVALAAKINDDFVDLAQPIVSDSTLKILTEHDPDSLEIYRHSRRRRHASTPRVFS